MKPTLKLLLALSLAGLALAWTEEKPVEEDFCDAEWDGKVEYKEEGETDQADQPEKEEQDQEESTTAEPAAEEGGEEKKVDDEGTESPEEKGATEEGKEPGEGPTGEGEEPRGKEKQPGEKASKDEEKADPRNTYDKAAGLVHAAANVDDIQDGYLKGSLNNRLQEHIRNPIIGAAGKLGNFKKIEPCFKTMNQDLKKEIDASKKEFADCKKKTDSSHECMVKMEPGFAAHVKAIGEKIVQCMNKSK
uniref:Putative 30 kDa salivary gland allergen aegyptin n=1 Tax=Culex tarsalis TaxID=7177 RepID=A0A1Q3EV01_CULTA